LGAPDPFSHRRHTHFAMDDLQIEDIPIHNPQRLAHRGWDNNAAFFANARPRPQFYRFGNLIAFQDFHIPTFLQRDTIV
jgi:hypothetical protein